MVYDVIGFQMSDAVIDELTIFQRAVSDDEIRTLRELGQNNVPLSRADAAPPPPAVGPFTDADVQHIAALPAAQQVEEVRREMKRATPASTARWRPRSRAASSRNSRSCATR